MVDLGSWKVFYCVSPVSEEVKLVTQGPYQYIRHPAYTDSLLAFAGIPLAIGTWSGVIVAIIVSWVVHQYRIRVEEEALQEAFGSEYEEYKKKTWELFPGFWQPVMISNVLNRAPTRSTSEFLKIDSLDYMKI
jgi:protein-S-isoprenylcysteine O-methyltransferase Ste14